MPLGRNLARNSFFNGRRVQPDHRHLDNKTQYAHGKDHALHRHGERQDIRNWGAVILWPWTATSTVEEYDPNPLVVDLNGDEKVDLKDFSILAQSWGREESSVDIGPVPWGDGRVDIQDIAALVEQWLTEF